MKKALIVASVSSAILLACSNDNSGTASQHDSTSHSSTTENTATNTPAQTNTANTASSASMMDLMNKNMQDMKAIQSTGNPDNDFAALMKVHHLGALEMAQAEIANGTNEAMKAMAQKMVDEQQREIAELNTFLSGHQTHGGGDGFYKGVMSQMNSMKMDMDHSGSFDRQFAQMMIPHHQGAIDMAKAYLQAGAHEEKLKTMANKLITDQQREIQQLQAWLANNR